MLLSCMSWASRITPLPFFIYNMPCLDQIFLINMWGLLYNL